MNQKEIFPVPTDSSDYDNALASLQTFNPIASEQFWGLTGTTHGGRLVWVPASYRMGYRNAAMQSNRRPQYSLNLGIVGQLTDGRWVFPLSYDEGLRDGLNDLRFAVLAEGERRLFNENRRLQREIELLRAKILG